jgi:Spy/CpxP family protein refolding chaperone
MRGDVSGVVMVRTLQRNPRFRVADTNLYKKFAGRHTPDTWNELNGHCAATHIIQPTQWRTKMNKSVKMIMAAAAMVALSASAFARGGDCAYGEPGGMMGMSQERMEKFHERHLATLHDKLKLTAQQETAWKKFAAQPPMLDKASRPDPAEMAKLHAPQRLEKGIEHMRAMETKMTEHLAALKEFYAVLTPEQQKMFDEQMPRFGERRGPRSGRK